MSTESRDGVGSRHLEGQMMKKHTALVALVALVGCKGSQQPQQPSAAVDVATIETRSSPDVASALDASEQADVTAPPRADAFADADESQFVPLNRGAVGRGRGFWCYRAGTNPDDALTSCFRAQSLCRVIRRSSIDRGDTATECAQESEAWCNSVSSSIDGNTVAQCVSAVTGGYPGCVRMRAAAMAENRVVTRYRNISRCELVQ